MDFLINNIGWFFCIVIVSILALIGYKADKKEKQQDNTNDKYIPKEEPTYEETPIEPKEENKEEDNFYYNQQEEIKPMENNEPQTSTQNEIDEEMAALYEPLPPMQDQNKKEESSKDQSLEDLYYFDPVKEQERQEIQEQIPNQIEEPAIEQNIKLETSSQEPTQIVPNINNLENLNLSLQDLENKKYNQLLNKMNQLEPTQELNQDSQTEIRDNSIVQEQKVDDTSMEQNNNEYIQETSESTQQMNQENNEDEQEQLPEQQEMQEQTMSSLEPTHETEQNLKDAQQEINEHQFDNEIASEQQTVEQNDVFAFNAQENKYEGAIPEIFETNQQNNDSINDTSYLEKAENSNNETNNETNLYNDSIDDDIWKF